MADFPAPDVLAKSKQKNCNGCVQAKRRCDRRTPTCSRCIEKRIPCTWGKRKLTTVHPSIRRRLECAPTEEALSFGGDYTPSSFVSSLDYLDSLHTPSHISAGAEISATPGDHMQSYVLDAELDPDLPMDSFLDLMNDTTPVSGQSLIQSEKRPLANRPGTPAGEGVIQSYMKMTGLCTQIEPWSLYDPKSLLSCVVRAVKSFVTDAGSRNATPFLHRYLYKIHAPKAILDCLATSLLYSNRTEENSVMVMRSLHKNIKELVEGEGFQGAGTPLERLARTQALFLYQVIRLMDGDIILRSMGENDIPLLHDWIEDLCGLRENLGEQAHLAITGMRSQPPKEWERWIFAESVRRTIIMAHSFLVMYSLMNNSKDTRGRDFWIYCHRWTISRHLWEAESSAEFVRAWKEKPQFIITNYSFEGFLEYGRGDDVDDFSRILLSLFLGEDETKEFMNGSKPPVTSA
uniref:Zn(2)-C6 fungal-type domain-containing protein n=1 Tax=Bionectria ochroleuca TaxID=29856 RepID=A0A8H7K3W7_BIOOC